MSKEEEQKNEDMRNFIEKLIKLIVVNYESNKELLMKIFNCKQK